MITEAYIAGRWHSTPDRFPVTSPSSGELIAEVADCGEAEARLAADAAAGAFDGWRRASPEERAGTLRRWAGLVRERADGLGRLIALELGRPLRQARDEALGVAAYLEWYAEEGRRVAGELLPASNDRERRLVVRQPVGPVYAVTPWNFPAMMPTWKAAPALAAGCTLILKPAEQTPLSALCLAGLFHEADGPPGVFQVLPALDPVPVSKVLMADERIRKLAFTGSTATGCLLYEGAAKTLKRVTLELGGHAPFIVFEDADLDGALAALAGKFFNAGQVCVSPNRALLHGPIEAAFAERFGATVSRLRAGDPFDEASDLGPLVDEAGLHKVQAQVSDALARGARLVAGGRATGGLFFEPTVLADARPGMRVLEEETFGPVAPLMAFSNEAEAVRVANATPYGLAAYVWTRDLGRAFRVAEALDYGMVSVNGASLSHPAPFGGVKSSGLGRENGRWGLEGYLETKSIALGLG